MTIFKSNNIVEFYLIDNNGSFLLIDAQKQKYILAVHNDQSLAEITNVLSEYSELDDTVKLINERISIPFFGIEKKLLNVDLPNIRQHLYPSTLIEGKQNYYLHLLKYDGDI